MTTTKLVRYSGYNWYKHEKLCIQMRESLKYALPLRMIIKSKHIKVDRIISHPRRYPNSCFCLLRKVQISTVGLKPAFLSVASFKNSCSSVRIIVCKCSRSRKQLSTLKRLWQQNPLSKTILVITSNMLFRTCRRSVRSVNDSYNLTVEPC